VRLLLDTHAFLWFITNDLQVSAAAGYRLPTRRLGMGPLEATEAGP
jgi:PIN domain nuclease of toxin-antitoxin system